MGLSLAVLATIYGVFKSQTHTVKGQETQLEAQEYALNVIDMMVREIRNTGYFPGGTACGGTVSTAGIVAADATTLQVVYDSNASGAACNETVIAYAYNSTTKNVTRAVNGGSAESLTDGNVTAFQLTYYPQQTSSTAPSPFCVSTGNPSGCSGTLSSNYSAVQKILVSITVQSKSNDVDFGGQSTITMSLNADLRNHGLPS
jgi:hypothetical protein